MYNGTKAMPIPAAQIEARKLAEMLRLSTGRPEQSGNNYLRDLYRFWFDKACVYRRTQQQ